MRPHIVAVLLGVLFVLSALSPAAAAPEDEEIPLLRINFEDKYYQVGDELNVTVELTANGRHVNANLPGVTLHVFKNFSFAGGGGMPDIESFGMGLPNPTGVYNTAFTINADYVTKMMPVGEGIPYMGKVIFMMAYANITLDRDYVIVSSLALAKIEDGPVINVAVNNHYPDPGDEVEITVTTTNGTAVDAADVVVGLSSYDGEVSRDLADLTVIRQSTGVYKATYTVPIDLTDATMYTIHAGASFADYNESMYLSPLFGTGFLASFYDIWLQNVSSTEDAMEVAAWIADKEGNALEGIDIDLDVTVYLQGGGTDTQTLANTTDENGRAGFLVTLGTADRMDVTGMASDGTLYQSFYLEALMDESPATPPTPEDPDSDFSVEAWEESEAGPIWDMIKEPGDPVHVKYRVFNTTGTVPHKRINWYLIDREGFFDSNWTTLDSGFEVTDANGDFDLTFQVPDNDVNGWLMFEAVMWNSGDENWERMEVSDPLIDAGFFSRDEDIEITVDRVQKETPVELRATVPLPTSYYIGQFFAVFDPGTGLTQWGQPQSLGPMSDDFNIQPLPKIGPDLFGMDKQLPEFFPEDQSIAFMVLSVDLELFKIEMNYVIMGYGESSTKGIDLAQATEPEPIPAGSNGTLEFQVDNTGAGTDHYTLDVTTGPDWLEWEAETLTVEPAETGTFAATVVVPGGTDEDRYYFNVTVTSDTDDTVSQDIELWVDVMVNGVDVGIVDDEATAFPEETVEFVVSMENTGQGNDTYDITLTGDAAPWATPSQTSLTLQEGGTAEVVVQVIVPEDADEATYALWLTATSQDGVTNDTVAMMVNVLVDGVDVEAVSDMEETWRSTPVTFQFNVTNTGQGNDTFTFSVDGDEPDWAVLSDESMLVEEGETVAVTMEVTPPGTADADFYEFTLVATSANGVTNASASSDLHLWVTGVELTPDDASKDAYRGEQIMFDIGMENTGQERDVYSLSHEGADWAKSIIFGSNPVALDADDSGTVTLTVILPDGIDEGIYTMTVGATSSDGVTMATVDLEVSVTVNGVDISLSTTSLTITKGKSKEVELTITNTGQGSDSFNILLAGAASNWTEVDKTVVTLEEGASETLTLVISPAKGEEGKQAFLDITVSSSDPEFSADDQVEVLLKEPPEEGGLSSTMIIAIVVIIIIVVALLVYMMQARSD